MYIFQQLIESIKLFLLDIAVAHRTFGVFWTNDSFSLAVGLCQYCGIGRGIV